MYGEDGAELFITGLGSDAGSMLASATTSVAVINPTGVASTSLTGLPARAPKFPKPRTAVPFEITAT